MQIEPILRDVSPSRLEHGDFPLDPHLIPSSDSEAQSNEASTEAPSSELRAIEREEEELGGQGSGMSEQAESGTNEQAESGESLSTQPESSEIIVNHTQSLHDLNPYIGIQIKHKQLTCSVTAKGSAKNLFSPSILVQLGSDGTQLRSGVGACIGIQTSKLPVNPFWETGFTNLKDPQCYCRSGARVPLISKKIHNFPSEMSIKIGILDSNVKNVRECIPGVSFVNKKPSSSVYGGVSLTESSSDFEFEQNLVYPLNRIHHKLRPMTQPLTLMNGSTESKLSDGEISGYQPLQKSERPQPIHGVAPLSPPSHLSKIGVISGLVIFGAGVFVGSLSSYVYLKILFSNLLKKGPSKKDDL